MKHKVGIISYLLECTLYMELVDEKPERIEPMMLVAEDLLEKFGTPSCDSWVVLIGVGKTYQYLMQVK